MVTVPKCKYGSEKSEHISEGGAAASPSHAKRISLTPARPRPRPTVRRGDHLLDRRNGDREREREREGGGEHTKYQTSSL